MKKVGTEINSPFIVTFWTGEQYFDCFNSSTNLTEMMKTRKFNMTVAMCSEICSKSDDVDGLQNGIACFCFSNELELDVCTTECGGSPKCGAWDTEIAAYNCEL